MLIKGINEDKVRQISSLKKEDSYILDYRLKCYELFKKLPLPSFGPTIDLDFDKPYMYIIRDKSTGEVWFAGTVYEPGK